MSSLPPPGNQPNNLPPQQDPLAAPSKGLIKPVGGSSATSQFTNYPRATTFKDPIKLQELADAYFGLNTPFVATIAAVFILNLLGRFLAPSMGLWPTLIICAVILFCAVFAISLPRNKDVGEALDWSPNGPYIASALMGLNAAFIFGIVGFIVLQSMLARKMRDYGVRGRAIGGISKQQIDDVIRQLRLARRGAAPPPGTYQP